MKNYILFFALCSSFFLQRITAQSLIIANFENEVATATPEVLVFQSGFEGNTSIIPYGTSSDDDIIGSDPNLTLSNWTDLQTNYFKTIYINYSGGDTTKRYSKIIIDPTNSSNKVLKFCLKDYWLTTDAQEKARIQLELHDLKNGYKEFFQSVRTYLTTDFNTLNSYPSVIDWCTLAEFWNNGWWGNKPYGFRISLNIHKDVGIGKNLQFEVTAQDSGFINIWSRVNTNLVVPIGQWVTIDYYFREGNKDTGRFYMAITPDGGAKQVVFDVTDFTHATKDPAPDGLTDYNPVKLYTSKEIMTFVKSKGKALNIYWDDLKLWINKRP